jgi:hypothetical protein
MKSNDDSPESSTLVGLGLALRERVRGFTAAPAFADVKRRATTVGAQIATELRLARQDVKASLGAIREFQDASRDDLAGLKQTLNERTHAPDSNDA